MAIEVGVAYLSILPSTSKLAPEIKKDLKAVEAESAASGKRSGSGFMAGFGGMVKKAGAAGLVAGGVAAGAAVLGGFKSAIDQQSTKATLAGLYDSSKVAKNLMKDLAKVSKTSTIDYSAYTSAAEALAYMGVEGKDAPKMLENIGDAIAGAGGGSEEMGRASDSLLKMVNAGQVQLDTLNQLSESGVPIYSALADQQGVSIKKLREMVTAGEIGIDDVQSAIKNANGDSWKLQIASAKRGEKTLSGQWKMLKDNVTRTLGTLFAPAIESLGNFIGKVSDWVAGGGLERALDQMKAGFEKVTDFIVKFKDEIIAVGAGIGIAIASLVAYNAYVKVAAAVTKVWTFATKLLNGTLRLNPIGLVVTAIALLVGAFVLAYRKSDTFRAVVNRAWASIKKGLKAAWEGYIKPALKAFIEFIQKRAIPAIKRFWQKVIKPTFRRIGQLIRLWWNKIVKPTFKALKFFITKVLVPTIKFLWQKVFKPAFKAIGDIVKVWWNKIVKPQFKFLKAFLTKVVFPVVKFLWNKVFKPTFKAIGDVVKFAWNKVIKPAFNAMKDGIGAVKDAFESAKNGIKRIWNLIRAAVAKPVNFVINTVWNNGLRKVIGAIPGVPTPGKIPTIPGYATGGVLPGYTPGRDVHRFYSPTGGSLDLSGGEGIMRPEFVRQVGGTQGVHRLNAAARRGRLRDHLGGFFLGGVLPLPGATSISQHSGYPWAKWSGDLNAPGDLGKPAVAWKSGRVAQVIMRPDSYGNHVYVNHGGQSTLYAHLSSFAANVGQAVRAGQMIGRVGSTGNSSGPHLHFEVRGGSISQGPSVTVLSPKQKKEKRAEKAEKSDWLKFIASLPGKIKSVWSGIKNMAGDGWSGLVKNAPSSMIKDAARYIDHKIPNKVALKWVPDLNLPDNPLKSLGIYDNGGILPPGGVAVNLSRKPEAVFTHRQFSQYANGRRSERVEMTITNWRTGEGYMRRIADDAIDDAASYSGLRTRMGA